MIRNEREYRIINSEVERFRAAIEESAKAPAPPGVHARVQTASIDALRIRLRTRERELHAYEALKRGTKQLRGNLEEIGALLVQARIARAWTQRELADRLGLHMQKIQQYEATNYEGASAARLRGVARTLGAVFDITVDLVALPDHSARMSRQNAKLPPMPLSELASMKALMAKAGPGAKALREAPPDEGVHRTAPRHAGQTADCVLEPCTPGQPSPR